MAGAPGVLRGRWTEHGRAEQAGLRAQYRQRPEPQHKRHGAADSDGDGKRATRSAIACLKGLLVCFQKSI